MKVSTLVSSLVLLLSASGANAAYTLNTEWSGSTFFDNFNFFTDADPNHGFVQYQGRTAAQNLGLIKTTASGASYIGVDYQNKYSHTAVGRKSVRIESKKSFTRGLFVADVAHMPNRACGTWPAFWTLGSGTWPANGEIDIIEGVSRQTQNQVVLHTANSCTVGNSGSGTLLSSECSVPASTSGCSVLGDTSGYGDVFNTNGGGVYAMEWTANYIKVWFFPRNSIPAGIKNGNPIPGNWGQPVAWYTPDNCDFANAFKNHRLIFNTNFCGDWAGAVYDQNVCPSTAGASNVQSCVNHVADHPAAFQQAYWQINSVKIYKQAATSRVRRGLDFGVEEVEDIY